MFFVIEGDPRTKKNHQQIRRKYDAQKRCYVHFIAQSDQSTAYEYESMWKIPQVFRELEIDIPVNVKCVYYMKTHGKVDLVNLLEGTDDILVRAGVLKDDNAKIICGHDGSRVRYDKNRPRVEIEITRMVDE